MGTFKLYRDWLKRDEQGQIKDVLRDGYKAFGFLAVACYDHAMSVPGLKMLYRQHGLKNNKRRDAAIQELLATGIILEGHTALDRDELIQYMREKYKEELNQKGLQFDDSVFAAYQKNLKFAGEGTGLTVVDPALDLPSISKARGGFIALQDSLMQHPGIAKHAGKLIQVYLYLALSAAWKAHAVDSPGLNGSRYINYLHVGDSSAGVKNMERYLGIHRTTVTILLEELVAGGLIQRQEGVGPRIYQVKELIPKETEVPNKKRWWKKKAAAEF